MLTLRCPSDPAHDTFRVVARRVQRVASFLDRQGRPRLDVETVIEASEEIVEAVCSECGAVAVVLRDGRPTA